MEKSQRRDERYLPWDDSQKVLYHFGFTISLKGKPTRLGSIFCRVWNTIHQGVWSELYFIYNKIPDFKGTLETF